MKRRNFLKAFLSFLGSVTFISFAYPAIRFFSPSGDEKGSGGLVVNKKDITPGSALNVMLDNKPVMIVHRRNEGFVALSRVCTHLGCLVSYDVNSDRIICPCHAAVFNLEGNVIDGPAPRPLDRVAIQVKSDRIYVG